MTTPSISSPAASGYRIYRRLLRVVKPYRMLFVFGLLAMTASSGIDAAFAWLIKPIVNQGFIDRDEVFIRWLPLLIITIFILRGAAIFISNYCVAKVGRSVVMDFRQQLFTHLLRLPASFYDGESSGQLLSKLIYNVEQVAEASMYAVPIIVQEGTLAIGLIIVMFVLNWQLALLFMVVGPIMAFIVKYSSNRMRRLSANAQKSVGEISHIAEESIEGYKVIRVFGGENYEINKFFTATKNNRQREMKMVVTHSISSTSVQLLISCAIALVLFLATSKILAVSAGTFAALITAMIMLLRPIRRISQINTMISKGIAGAQSVFELLDAAPEKDTGTKSIQRVKGRIDYNNVNFIYPTTQKTVLTNINFHAEPGERIALVGRSGSGKTSIVNLLPRFYDVNGGTITIDGVDIHDYHLADLRHQFALVSQHVTLFNDTVAANIAYGQQDCDREVITRAAVAAHAMEFIAALPQGLDTLIGENGVLLSGGQRQRIAIARAILKDAPILILDEATSALDTESERHVQAALEELMQHRTTLVVAHRLSTIEHADRILVVDQGAILEVGNHAQLLAQNGYYAKLYAMQFNDKKITDSL